MSKKAEKQKFADVYAALAHTQKALKVPKNQFNKFGKYNYRSCEDILEAVKKTMPEGAAVYIYDDIESIDGRFYIIALAEFRYGGDVIVGRGLAREEETKKGMDGCQITGTASSYARKYALNGLFMIDDTKDADTDEHAQERQKKAAAVDKTKAETAAKTAAELIAAIYGYKTPEALIEYYNTKQAYIAKLMQYEDEHGNKRGAKVKEAYEAQLAKLQHAPLGEEDA